MWLISYKKYQANVSMVKHIGWAAFSAAEHVSEIQIEKKHLSFLSISEVT